MSAYTNPYSGALGAPSPSDGREWVVLLSPDTRRMMSTLEVRAEVGAGRLARETLVWRAGMSDWMAIASIGELDVPPARPHRAAPAGSWDAPVAAPPPRAGGHSHARQHAQRQASSSEIMQELVTAGAVAAIMVAFTLYMLSLGGAFASGSTQHAAHAPASNSPQKAH